jgi:Flp pilus assembly protein CpaB
MLEEEHMAASRRRRSGLILILLAILLIIGLIAVAILMGPQLLSAISGNSNADLAPTPLPAVATEEILVLSQPVSKGNQITENILIKVRYPASEMLTGLFITDENDVIGKRARYDLPAHIPLTANLLTKEAGQSLAAFEIPAGMVAISMPIDRLSAVSYALQPGDHVNIIGSMLFVDLDTEFQTKLPNAVTPILAPMPGEQNPVDELALTETDTTCTLCPDSMDISPLMVNPSIPWQIPILGRFEAAETLSVPGGTTKWMHIVPGEIDIENNTLLMQRPRLVSQALIQDAIVLWVGDFNEPTDTQAPVGPTPTPIPGEVVIAEAPISLRPDIITLVVTPQDAITLNYLMLAKADLNLALRSAGDTIQVNTEAVTLQFIMEQYNVPLPSKLPYGLEPRIESLEPNLPEEPIIITGQ